MSQIYECYDTSLVEDSYELFCPVCETDLCLNEIVGVEEGTPFFGAADHEISVPFQCPSCKTAGTLRRFPLTHYHLILVKPELGNG